MSVSIEATPNAHEAREGYAVVGFDSVAYGRVDYESDDPTATEATDLPGHFDGSRYTVACLVTDGAVWRVQGEPEADSAELDPQKGGTLLECF